MDNRIQLHELEIGSILESHYKTRVDYLFSTNAYKRKTADIVFKNRSWEIKSPTGNSKTTIAIQFKRAVKQSKNIIIDGRRTKLHDKRILLDIQKALRKHPNIKSVIFINKNQVVVEIK